ncbi:MAG: hypothetical protein A2V21_311325 [Deltaproteobacteria bacterium GWC2_55_46]|nr:MAG: hypothetical protein A2Z79_12040 [Deltaproteobacteria bacterium GWA2_55_82]OGQ65262.1 MAG: hypothetical protein A3I81_02440 [Deltaproteobacteria bacterium RIFCSPLOWO2_02_FULL_55_12]OIJ75164.1 MAG: hypothetical protein A2V21_311325 [Deltaproteobacteria bacterium GWC2_55_46]
MSVAYKHEIPHPAEAFGKPGLSPRWSRASKQGVGTALSAFSRVWFTIADGIITEVYYPDTGTADIKDLRFLVTDSKTFFDEEGTDTEITSLGQIHEKAPGYIITNTAKSGLWSITKRVITDPQANSLVIHTDFKALHGTTADFRLFVLLAPHIKNKGAGNSGKYAAYGRRNYLLAWREDIAAALSADQPFLRMSAGYSGVSDGWHDLKDNLDMDWSFEKAEDGNIALIAELKPRSDIVLALSFGKDEAEAVLDTERTLSREYHDIEREYIRGWRRYLNGLMPLGRRSADGGRRFWTSAIVLKTHEDKTSPGALVASLSIPWGEVKGDEEALGYHLVWPRDLCKSAFAFLAMGDGATALSILRYLGRTQAEAGNWPQNMYTNGEARWPYVQLDQTALPIILAWRLKGMGLAGDEFYPMVKKAASFIAANGPITEQERWEEGMGLSPATLAAEVSALVTAAHWAREMNEETASEYLFSTADHWQTRIEEWTFAECDCIGEGVPGHYMWIVRSVPESIAPGEQVCHALVFNRNRPKDRPHHQGEIVDTGFLDLVRFGVRGPSDPHILSSIKVADRFLRFEHNGRVAFHRYNGDGYGEKEDGAPFDGSGVGRPWPLLTGERALYEIMAGGEAQGYIRSFEEFANEGHLFPEQVWDSESIPARRLYRGRGTGSATPLSWAHAEYIKLLRSARDNAGCDLVEEVKARYIDRLTKLPMAAWKKSQPVSAASSGEILRIISLREANLVWTSDNWATKTEEPMAGTGLRIWRTDFSPERFAPGTRLFFTFYYNDTGEWEGKDYEIRIY